MPLSQAVRWLKRHWWLVPSILAAGVIGFIGWYQLGLRAVGSGAVVAFTVKSGSTTPTVATALKDAGLIRNRDAFITYMNLHGLRAKLKAGSFPLSPSYSSAKIAGLITSTATSLNQLVIPEGYSTGQIETLASGRGISRTDFEAALAAAHTNPGLSTKPAGVGLEGYLFPDSYEVIPGTTTATSLVNAMLANFDARVGTTYDAAFATHGLNRHQGLTLASIVEKEVSKPEDRPLVAQVFLKRLQLGMPLGSDVTVDYAAAQLGTTFNTGLNSPYNTYRFAGLPPGPISNPGLSALDAVAHPAATNYLYFLAGSDGVTHFAMTYAEHQQNVAKYLH